MAMRNSYSAGQSPHTTTVRFDQDLFAELVHEATRRNLTINAMLNQVLRDRYQSLSRHQAVIDKLGGS